MTKDEKTEVTQAGATIRTREKIIYKIIPVPYYYPVPTDAEWYGDRSKQIHNEDHTTKVSSEKNPNPPPPPPPAVLPHSIPKHPNASYGMKKKTVASPIAGKELLKVVRKDESGAKPDNRFSVVYTTKDKRNDSQQVKEHHPESIAIKAEETDEKYHRSTFGNEVQSGPEKLSHRVALDEMKQVKSAQNQQQRTTFPYDDEKTENPANGQTETLESPSVPTVGVQIPQEKPSENVQHIIVPHAAMPPAGLSAIPGGNPAGYAIQSMHGLPMMIPGGMPYVVVPMPSPHLHVQQPQQVRPCNTGSLKPTPSSTTPPPPLRLPPPRMMIDTTKLASAELSSIKEDMRNWEMEIPKEREKLNEHHQQHQGVGRRSRTVFTRHQLITLNSIFKKQNFISGKRMRELSDELGLDRKTVKIWFQNKRQYLRKKASPQPDTAFTNEEDYLMYRDISSSEILHPPPTMTSSGRTPYNGDGGENLDIMDTEEGHESSNELENDVFDDNEIITVQMKHDIDDPEYDTPRRERGQILHREMVGVPMDDSVC